MTKLFESISFYDLSLAASDISNGLKITFNRGSLFGYFRIKIYVYRWQCSKLVINMPKNKSKAIWFKGMHGIFSIPCLSPGHIIPNFKTKCEICDLLLPKYGRYLSVELDLQSHRQPPHSAWDVFWREVTFR